MLLFFISINTSKFRYATSLYNDRLIDIKSLPLEEKKSINIFDDFLNSSLGIYDDYFSLWKQ